MSVLGKISRVVIFAAAVAVSGILFQNCDVGFKTNSFSENFNRLPSDDWPQPEGGDGPAPEEPSLPPVPANPFGMGAAFSEFMVNQPEYRERQLQQTRHLAGKGGHVRLWCRLTALSECQTSILRTYELDLVPSVVMADAPVASDTVSPHRDYSAYSTRFAEFVHRLPRIKGRTLFVELTNEPNFTDWWASLTCDSKTRAIEIAQASAQVAIKIRAIADARIKIVGVSLSPFSDSNPIPNGDGTCKRGTTLDLPSTYFVTEMKRERPDLYSAPLIDVWNSHPYPMEVFGSCARPNCPSTMNDPALRAYQAELMAAGLPSDFPIFLTEVGTYISIQSQTTADMFASNSNFTVGAYPQVWLANGPYNNVKGIMGFILPAPGLETYAWLDLTSPLTAVAPFQSPWPIYTQVRNLRRQLGYAD